MACPRLAFPLAELSPETWHELWLQVGEAQVQLQLAITATGEDSPAPPGPQYVSQMYCPIVPSYKSMQGLAGSLAGPVRDVGRLAVTVLSARGLRSADLGGSSDPYAVVQLGNSCLRTKTDWATLDPAWGNTFVL